MFLTTFALAVAVVGQGQPDWFEPFPAHKVIGSVSYVGSKDLATLGHADAFVNPEGYKKYVAQKEQAFRQTLSAQQANE